MVKDCCCMTNSNLVDFFQFSSGTFRECGAYRSPGAGGGQSIYGLRSTATGAPVQERNNGQRLACVLYAA